MLYDVKTQIVMAGLRNNYELLSVADASQFGWDALIRTASQNKVLYEFALNILQSNIFNRIHSDMRLQLVDICEDGEHRLVQATNTLRLINHSLKKAKIKYLVVKTKKPIDYITYDVDVLVHPSDYIEAMRILGEFGQIKDHPRKQGKYQKNIETQDLLVIDLHKKFSWEGGKFMDDSFIWENTRRGKVFGVMCPIPSNGVELLLLFAHILYERKYVTILDLITFVHLMNPNLNDKQLGHQLRKYGWKESFVKLAKTLIEHPSQRDVSLPYMLPSSFIIKEFLKRLSKRQLMIFDFGYYIFSRFRYYLTFRRILPYHVDWWKP